MGITLQQSGTVGSSRENINVRAAYIHVIGDFLQSFGVFTAALIVYFRVRNFVFDYLLLVVKLC